MSIEQNKAKLRRIYEGHINSHDADAAAAESTPDVVIHFAGMPEPIRGREGLRHLMAAYFAAFPDMQTTIEDMIGEDDLVAVRHTWRGTQRGTFQGIPATGKQVTFTSIDLCRMMDGKLAEQWSELDNLGMLQPWHIYCCIVAGMFRFDCAGSRVSAGSKAM